MTRTTSPFPCCSFAHRALGAPLALTSGAPARVLVALLLVCSSTVRAQVTVSPSVIEVTVPQGEMATAVLTLSNASTEPQRLALSLVPSADDLPSDGTAPGDVLFVSDDFGDPIALTALPDGHLFVTSGNRDFIELTPTLGFVREFGHAQTAFLSNTVGLAYNADARSPLSATPGEGTLWWHDQQTDAGEVTQAILMEGTLGDPTATGPFDDAWDSQPTGRTLPVVVSEAPACTYPAGRPSMLAYDAVSTPLLTGGAGLFYWLDIAHDAAWASDTLGNVADGYPVPLTDYKRTPWGDPDGEANAAECLLGFGLDAHALSVATGPDGAVLPGERVFEVMVGFQDELPFGRASRAVVVDRQGRSRGAETPFDELPPAPDGEFLLQLLDVVRSRVDPAVLYVIGVSGPVGSSVQQIVYGVRAAPLPPPWLHAERVLWEVAAEGGQEVGLRLETAGLAVGVYEGVVAVRLGDGIGDVIAEVPVTLTVTEGTNAEDEAGANEEPGLSVYPNPSWGAATVTLVLGETADVAVSVYDVLGRRVVVLHEGAMEAGTHTLSLTVPALPAGVYLVRVEGGRSSLTERITVLR